MRVMHGHVAMSAIDYGASMWYIGASIKREEHDMKWDSKEAEIATLRRWIVWNKRQLDEVYHSGVPELVEHHEKLIFRFETRIAELEN